jgi:hypothetical protein
LLNYFAKVTIFKTPKKRKIRPKMVLRHKRLKIFRFILTIELILLLHKITTFNICVLYWQS